MWCPALQELMLDQGCHVLEEANLLQAELAGPNIQHTQGTDAALTDEQRAARVKSDTRTSRNLRIVCKTIVSKYIRDHEELPSGDGVRTER